MISVYTDSLKQLKMLYYACQVSSWQCRVVKKRYANTSLAHHRYYKFMFFGLHRGDNSIVLITWTLISKVCIFRLTKGRFRVNEGPKCLNLSIFSWKLCRVNTPSVTEWISTQLPFISMTQATVPFQSVSYELNKPPENLTKHAQVTFHQK